MHSRYYPILAVSFYVSQLDIECVLTLCFSEPILENWTPLMHPEGALYWVHETKVSLCTHSHTTF
jgi:hypothetical protein